MKRTRLGIEAENMGQPVFDPGIVSMAKAIEDAGADSVSVSDHLLSFSDEASASPASPGHTWLESLTCLAAISSVTTRVKLIAAVVILPQRNVLELLKTATTIDYLSGGRLVLGVGAGWNAREMEALGYDFTTRGRRMDEMLAVIRGAANGSVSPFSGDYVRIPEGIVMSPSASPDHTIPFYIGGSGVRRVSIRRAIEFGDGWMAYSPSGRYDSAALQRTLAHLRNERMRLGKEPLDMVFKLHVNGHTADGLEREVVDLAAMGFDEIIVQGIWNAGLTSGIDAIQRIRHALDR